MCSMVSGDPWRLPHPVNRYSIKLHAHMYLHNAKVELWVRLSRFVSPALTPRADELLHCTCVVGSLHPCVSLTLEAGIQLYTVKAQSQCLCLKTWCNVVEDLQHICWREASRA